MMTFFVTSVPVGDGGNLGGLAGDTLVQAQRGNNFFKQSARNEHGQVIHGNRIGNGSS